MTRLIWIVSILCSLSAASEAQTPGDGRPEFGFNSSTGELRIETDGNSLSLFTVTGPQAESTNPQPTAGPWDQSFDTPSGTELWVSLSSAEIDHLNTQGVGLRIATYPEGTQLGDFLAASFDGIAISGGTALLFEIPTGDFNIDGITDINDLELLVDEVSNQTHTREFDLNGDGVVSIADRDEWVGEIGGIGPTVSGDANLDGVVDGEDFNRWNSNRFTETNDWGSGNFDDEDVVDGGDFIIWNSFKSVPNPAGSSIAAAGLLAEPTFLFDPATGELSADNANGLNGIVVKGPEAMTTVDELLGVQSWVQAFFNDAEQWVDTDIVTGGIAASSEPELLATYAPGTALADFGPVKWGLFDRTSGLSAVQLLPEPSWSAQLAFGTLAMLYRRRRSAEKSARRKARRTSLVSAAS